MEMLRVDPCQLTMNDAPVRHERVLPVRHERVLAVVEEAKIRVSISATSNALIAI